MDDQLQHSDILHGITNDVFQKVLDLGPSLREFITLAKQYHKALLGASMAANSFYQGFTKIAYLASDTKSSNKMLGKGICDIIAVNKQIENQASNVLKALSQDFIIPLEEWTEKEMSRIKSRQKNYNQDHKASCEHVEKSRADLTKVRKKSQRSKTSDKYEQKEQQIMTAHDQFQNKLDKLRISGCHEAINIQRNVFSFIVEKGCAVSKTDVIHHEKAFSLLNSRLPIWDKLIKQPLSLELNVNSLLKQLTENGNYDKSLDEHLSRNGSLLEPSPSEPKKIIDKRLSHQFSVASSSVKQTSQTDGAEDRVKLQALFAHDAADSTQLSFKEGDVIRTLTEVTSGWQYGENTRTKKSGWFPVTFTEKVIGVVTSSNPSHTLPSQSHSHSRPTVVPTVNGLQLTDKIKNESFPHIPEPDYAIPLNDVKTKENNNHIQSNQEVSLRAIGSPGSPQIPARIPEMDEAQFPPPPPPPLKLDSDDENHTPFPPPPPPPLPAVTSTGSFDQAL